MPKGIKRDERHIRRYQTASGLQRFQVRLTVDGQRFTKSFGALDEAIQWRNERIEERRQGKQFTKPQQRQQGRNLVTFVKHEYWHGYVEKTLAHRTRHNYGRHFKKWVAEAPLGRKAPELIDSEDILEWQEWCRAHGATPHQIRVAQKVISGAYTWASRRPRSTGIQANPVASAEWPGSERELTPYIVDHLIVEEIRQEILRADVGRQTSRARAALLLSIMAQTGMRPSEARQLRVHDVDLDKRVIQLPAVKSKKKGKRGKQCGRAIPLWQPLAEDIEASIADQCLSAGDYLVGRLGNDDGMSLSGWQRWRNDFYAPARDLVAERHSDSKLGTARASDLCRHSYVAQQIAALMPLTRLSEIMGHSVETS